MTTTLTTVDVEVPTDRLPSVGGAEAKVPATALLLPGAPTVRPYPGDELDVSVSSEVAAELALGTVVAVPASAGEPRPFEVVAEPRDGWIRVRPARDKNTLATALAEENARDSDLKRRAQRAANERLDQMEHETERALEALRGAGFGRVAEAMARNDSRWGYELGLDACLREDAAAMREREDAAAAT